MCALVFNLRAQQSTKGVPSADVAYDYALELILGGSQSAIVDKRVGPIRAIVTCSDADTRSIVNQAAAAINDAFGYGKIALSESERARLEDDAITIYVGSKSDGRRLVEDFGVSSPRAFRDSVYYYWWDNDRRHHIRRCLIAADMASPQDRKTEDLQYLILACMGVRNPWSSKQYQLKSKGPDASQTKLFSDLDVAIIRFFDKHVPPGAKSWEMRNVFKREWPDFSAAYWNPSKDQKTPLSTTSQ